MTRSMPRTGGLSARSSIPARRRGSDPGAISSGRSQGDQPLSMAGSPSSCPPLLAHDTKSTLEQVKSLHRQQQRPKIFIKIPGTPEGLPAIEEAIFSGIPINVTLLFSREQYVAAAAAYQRGIERRIAVGLDPDVVSVASVFISRWDKAVQDRVPAQLRSRLGIAIAGRTYRAYRELLDSRHSQSLASAGARHQRLLWASTGTKDPRASDVLYVEALAAPDTINTMRMHAPPLPITVRSAVMEEDALMAEA